MCCIGPIRAGSGEPKPLSTLDYLGRVGLAQFHGEENCDAENRGPFNLTNEVMGPHNSDWAHVYIPAIETKSFSGKLLGKNEPLIEHLKCDTPNFFSD